MNAKLLEERTVFHIGTPARVERVRLAPDWGVANLIIPGAVIPFCIFHLKEAKRPMILAVVCLVVFIILWVYARHGSHARPRIDVAPALPASATDAILHLKLASFNAASQTGSTISSILSQKDRVMFADPSHGLFDEERLIAIRADGFVIQFIHRESGETRTNLVLFPYGQVTETNTMGWTIVGSY